MRNPILLPLIFFWFGMPLKLGATETTNVVRFAPTPSTLAIPNNVRLKELAAAAITAVNASPTQSKSADLVAWSLRLDHLDQPPRLFEEAIVQLHVLNLKGASQWVVVHLRRTLGQAGDSWTMLYYPPLSKPPVATLAKFASKPSDQEIAHFIRSSDFGYNCLYPEERTIDVVLYRHSPVIEKVVREGISTDEKRTRRSLHEQGFDY